MLSPWGLRRNTTSGNDAATGPVICATTLPEREAKRQRLASEGQEVEEIVCDAAEGAAESVAPANVEVQAGSRGVGVRAGGDAPEALCPL